MYKQAQFVPADAGFLPDLFFGNEDGGDLFLRNVA
jgi:hypothetical protein